MVVFSGQFLQIVCQSLLCIGLGIGYKTPNSHRLTNPTHQSMLVEEEAVYVHVQNPIPPLTSENARNSEKMPENLENGKN